MEEEQKKEEGKEIAPEISDLEKAKQERDEYLNGWKRAKADLINYQKDESKRFADMVKFGNIDIMRDMIPVLDSFDLAISLLEKEGKADKGVYMIKSQLEDVLKKKGLETIVVKIGDPFNPQFHESLGELEGDGPPGAIAVEIEKGYMLHERVIRPTRVKLIKPKQ